MDWSKILPWKCKACGHTNSGKNTICVFCRKNFGEYLWKVV